MHSPCLLYTLVFVTYYALCDYYVNPYSNCYFANVLLRCWIICFCYHKQSVLFLGYIQRCLKKPWIPCWTMFFSIMCMYWMVILSSAINHVYNCLSFRLVSIFRISPKKCGSLKYLVEWVISTTPLLSCLESYVSHNWSQGRRKEDCVLGSLIAIT